MEIAQLEFFVAVADEGGISAAARKLHRVPSNLTTRIKQLEEELGADLFIREKSRLRPSPVGWTFLDYARRILSLIEESKLAVSGGAPQGHFALGALESTSAVRIPPLLSTFNQQHSTVALDLTTGASGTLLDGVLAGDLDAAFVDGPIGHPALEGVPVYEEEMVVIASTSHRAIKTAADVAGETIYAFRQNCSYRRHFENWFAADDVKPGKIMEMESYHGMLACVSGGGGIALMPRSMLESMSGAKNVKAYPLSKAFRRRDIWLLWRRGSCTPNVSALVSLIQS